MSFLKQRGNVWWYYWRDPTGRQRAKSLRTPDKIVAEVRKGEEDIRRHRGEAGLPNPAMLWTTFKRDFLAGYKPESRIRYLHANTLAAFERHASPGRLGDVTYAVAKGFRDWLQRQTSPHTGRPLKPATINIHLRNMHAFFNEARRARLVAENPFAEIAPVPDTKRAPRYLTLDQVAALFRQVRRDRSKELALMLQLFLYTGIRRSELVHLKWTAVDLEKDLLYLRGSETWAPKDREEHAIGLHPDLAAALRRWPRTSEYVFPGRNGPRCQYALTRLFNRLYRRAGQSAKDDNLAKIRGLHILRHTFATHFPGAEKVLQRILGHSSPLTTQRYRHVTPEELRAVRQIFYTTSAPKPL